MKLLLVAVFSSIALSVHAQCDTHFDACADLPDIALIACEASGAVPCTIVDGDQAPVEDGILGDLLGEPKIQTINAEECRKKCQEHADATETEDEKCKFFRWMDKDHENHPDIRCALQTECGAGDPYCTKREGCVSGQLGCDEDGNQILDCSLTAPVAWEMNKFHIICTDGNNNVNGDVNIYSDITIPGGTICSTVRMCDSWDDITDPSESVYYRKVAVECDGQDGTWKPRDDTGSLSNSTAMINEGENKIVEPECVNECASLKLTKYQQQEWADLICDEPLPASDDGVGNMLEDGNSCILLCDNHLKKSVDCGFTENGEKHWHDGLGEVLGDDDIQCGP